MAVTENNSSKLKKRALAVAVASCLSLASMASMAAGLGKLTVFSSLGQPLRAEMELSATPEELSGMTARLAPLDLFKQAGVDFSPSLAGLRFVVEKRTNGRSVVKLTSTRPVNEPFLDFLVELNWPAGRLVREYTFLLDPPEFSANQRAQNSVDAKIVETVRGGSVPETRAQLPSAARPVPAPKDSVAAKPGAKSTPATRLVERGDTLRKIAAETQYPGVSLEQMLVGLYRNNKDAFIGNDIHRLKAGVILNVPDQATVAAVSDRDARNVYVSSGDFSAYRRKLAGVAAATAPRDVAPVEQSSGGRITPKVEEKTPALDPSKDQVKVSRADVLAKDAGVSEVDRLARDKALQEAQARLELLEKNVGELQKLLEMKNQRLAELEKPVASGASPAPGVPADVPSAPATSEAVPAEAKQVEDVAPPTPEVKPAPAQQPPVKAPPPPPPVAVEPPGLLDTVLADPLPLAGGAAVIALLAGLLAFRRRKQGEGLPKAPVSAYSSGAAPDSGLRTTGGQSVDTGSVPLHTGEFSQAGPGTIDTDDVDPVAEADVYMAYGRDAQAEEILLEAMQKDPSRLAIHAKLLEIYANRRSLKQFETLAAELYAQTAGVGPEWEKVAALGAGIDPANPLYGAKDAADAPSPAKVFDPDATLVVKPGQLAAAGAAGGLAAAFDTVSPGGDSANEALTFTTEVEAPTEKVTDYEATMVSSAPLIDVLPEVSALGAGDEGMSLDFDLGGELDASAPPAATQASEEATFAVLDELPLAAEPEPEQAGLAMETESSSEALDFDLSGMVGGDSDLDAAKPTGELAIAQAADAALDELAAMDLPSFDEIEETTTLGGLDEVPGLAMPEMQPVSEVPEAEGLLDMDFDLDAVSVAPSADAEAIPALAPAASDVQETPAVVAADDIDLAFDMPEPSSPSLAALPESAEVMDFDITPEAPAALEEQLPESDFDLASINLDLSAEPLGEVSTAGISLEEDFAPLDGEVSAEAEALAGEAVAPQDDPRWEEVNTKLDLAKAYEEMGDLEGARELLQEVLGDGPADLAAQAKAILDRMGS